MFTTNKVHIVNQTARAAIFLEPDHDVTHIPPSLQELSVTDFFLIFDLIMVSTRTGKRGQLQE